MLHHLRRSRSDKEDRQVPGTALCMAHLATLAAPMMQSLPFSLAALNAQVSSSKLVWGAAAITASMGSRFIVGDITPAQQGMLTSPIVRRVVVFCMIFLPTRDVLLSICMTVVFFALMDGFLNERSRYCLLPECLRRRTADGVGVGVGVGVGGPALPVAHKMLSMAMQATHPGSHTHGPEPEGSSVSPAWQVGDGLLATLGLD